MTQVASERRAPRPVTGAERWRRRVRRLATTGLAYRPIFVAGVMGSGTSLLAHSLGQRFKVAGVATESALQVPRTSFLRMPELETFDSVSSYERAIQPGNEWSVEDGRAALVALYRKVSQRRHPAVVDKGPNTNLTRAVFLAACFADARFLLVLRDPVANIEGFRRKWPTFGREPLTESIRFYDSVHQRFLDFAEAHRPSVAVVSYDALVRDRDAVLDGVGSWIGLTPARRPNPVAVKVNDTGKGLLGHDRSSIRTLLDRDVQARARVPEHERELIDVSLRPLLERLSELRPVASGPNPVGLR